MAVTLSEPQQRRWATYLATERRGTREAMLRALDEFIEELLQSPEAVWKQWALDLAARIVDEREEIPIRHSLFTRVLFPALADALDAQWPGSARWLAGFEPYFRGSADCLQRLGPERSTPRSLLQSALAQDPQDGRARGKLIDVMANYLRYTLHEVPWGVLYGADGATLPQCDELLAELADFQSLVAVAGRTTEFSTLLAKCECHYNGYKQYLIERPKYQSYSGFLERRARGTSNLI